MTISSQAQWTFGDGRAGIVVPAQPQGADQVVLNLAIEELAAEGLLGATPGDAGIELKFSFDEWATIGRGPERAAGPEEREDAVTKLVAFGALRPSTGSLSVRQIGVLGKPRSRLVLNVDGQEVTFAAWPEVGGRPWMMSPREAAIAADVRDYERATTESGRMEAALLLRQRGLMSSAPLLKVDIPQAILKKRLVKVRSMSVIVDAASADKTAFTVAVDVEDEEGVVTRVGARTRHTADRFLHTEDGRFIELTDTQMNALDDLEFAKAVSEAQLGVAKDRPEALLRPESIDESMIFTGYSERVRGFQPATREEEWRNSSGIRWYLDEDAPTDADSVAFVSIAVRNGASGELRRVEIDTPERASQVLGLLERHIAAHGEDVGVEMDGHWYGEPRKIAKLIKKRLVEDQAEPAPPKPPKPGVLIAELVDAQAKAAPPATTYVEPDWALLNSCLADGMSILDHQREGIRWLWTRYELAKQRGARGVLLADEMGLGKTFQVACVLVLAKRKDQHTKPHLVVAPKILLQNWVDELHLYFRPKSISAHIVEASDLRGGRGTLVDKNGVLLERAMQEHDVWLINYDSLQAFGPALLKADWDIVVLDEAQAIKNARTAVSRNARGLKRRFAVASTGTPVENRIDDVFPIGDFAFPGILGANAGEFAARYSDGGGVAQLRETIRFGRGPESLVLRREKRVVLTRLPEKTTELVRLPMTERQRQQERDIVKSTLLRKGGAFAMLEQLQKLYQHPALLDPTCQAETAPLPQLLSESPKLSWLRAALSDIARRREKVLIFTVWTRMQALVSRLLADEYPALFARRNVVINGEPGNMRSAQARIRLFSERDGFDALILSPLAAGTGLTITAATHVIHYGRWWNPAREDQATDRAHRIGQTKPVTVWIPALHHPDSPDDGFDIRLHELVERKRAVAADFLAPATFEPSAEEVLKMVT